MDLPKGSTIWLFDQSDMARAKETIGKVACIEGNMPLSLLHAGTAQQVAEQLQRELPRLKSFCTLSPLPGFMQGSEPGALPR